MNKKHPSLHPLEIAPERFCRIRRKTIGDEHPDDKGRHGRAEPRKTRAICAVHEREHAPRDNRHFNQDTQIERLARDEGEEE